MSLLSSLGGMFLWFRLAVLRFALWFEQTVIWLTLPARVRATSHTVLLIGDGVAEGVGDQFGKTGLCGALTNKLRDLKLQGPQQDLRLNWRVATAGKLWSTSTDWLPGSQLMRQAIIRQASVVVVLLGSHDERKDDDSSVADGDGAGSDSDDELIENIIRITESLLDEEKMVVVPGIPNYFDNRVEPTQFARKVATAAQLNKRLDALAKKYAATESDNADSSRYGATEIKNRLIKADADIAKICALGDDTIARDKGFSTLNPRGFRLFAGDLFEDVVRAAKKVEWAYWKQELTGR